MNHQRPVSDKLVEDAAVEETFAYRKKLLQ